MIQLLSKSESILKKSLTVPRTGYRSLFWLIRISSLKCILESTDEYFDKKTPITDVKNIYFDVSTEYLTVLSFIKNTALKRDRIYHSFQRYLDAVSSRSLKSNILFSLAVFVWDFFPELKIDDIKFILDSLYKSQKIAHTNKEENLCIYSITGPILISAEDFISQLNETIEKIENKVGKIGHLKSEKQINKARSDGYKISLYYIIEKAEKK